MTHKTSLVGVLVAVAACGPSPLATTAGRQPTEAWAADLQYLREEEKLARDVYLTLSRRWGLPQHANIASAEQTHMDRAKATLDGLGIADPVRDDTVGVFVNGQLAELYRALVAQGQETEAASLVVGAAIEELDLWDIGQMRTRTTEPAALGLYDALACGSRNHLRSFVPQLTARQASYTPQHLTQDEYAAILAGAHEQCGR